MPTTLHDLLAERSLNLELVVEGDVRRPIRWVHVTELADPSDFLVGNELVLTAGIWRGRRHSAESFVHALESRDVAGIGYGLLAGHQTVPAPLVAAARRSGVPLVVVPVATPFIAISQLFVERLAADRERDLRTTLRLSSDLLRAAERPSARQALAEVARLLRRSTGRDVWIADAAGRLLGLAGPTPDAAVRRALLAAAAGTAPAVTGWAAHLIRADRGAGVVLAVSSPGTAGADLTVASRVDAARPVIGLVMARERAVREIERRLAGEVVSLVLGRQSEAAAARLASYGLDPYEPLVALVCDVGDRERALVDAEAWLDDSGRGGVVALRGHDLMLVLDGADLGERGAVVAVATELAAVLSAAAAGAGPVVTGMTELRRSLVHARQACELARRRGGGAIVAHEASGSHSLLLALQDEGVLLAFRSTILSPLEEHDARTGGELVATLRAFLDTGGRWQETAQRLHVHVNTLRYRLAKAEELTGRRLDSTPDRVDLWLALEASVAPAWGSGRRTSGLSSG